MNWTRQREHNLLTNAASLLLCGVLAGIVVAGAAFPVVAMGGLAAKASADTFAELPDQIFVPEPPQITYLYASDSTTLLATFYDENRHDVPLSEIPQVVRDAIIAAEDNRFYAHNGVDPKGVVRAFLSNQASGEDSGQGASTLTMQYVRQAITYGAKSPQEVLAATVDSPERKIREIRLALGVEKVLTKDQILEKYLNIAAFGRGAYGIYAASQVYFSKEPKDLTLAEAALLAGLPKAPSDYDPSTSDGLPRAQERRHYVLGQMADLGMISEGQRQQADESEIVVTGSRTPRDCIGALQNDWGFFCDFFYRWWSEQTDFGRDAGERIGKLKSGGYRITSSLDVATQNSANTYVEQQLPTGNRDALMVSAIEPNTGYVRAMKANRNFSLDDANNGESSDDAKRAAGIKGTFPNTTNPLLSGGPDTSGYKGGSTFKLFTMLAALENGYPLDFTINAVSPYQSKYTVEASSPAICPDRKHWCPRNASASMNGLRNMWTGFGMSVNTYFVPLIQLVGASKAIEMAQRLGLHFRNEGDQQFISYGDGAGPFTLGVTDVVPLELANAYATVAAEGNYCEPLPVVRLANVNNVTVTDDDGHDVIEPRCKQVISRDVALAAADAARCPVYQSGGLGRCAGGTAVSAGGRPADVVKHPVIGKTGTSDNNWTANFALATKQLAIAGILADPDKAEQRHDGSAGSKVQQAVKFTLRDFMVGKPALDWDKPPQNLVVGQKVNIPDVTCKSVEEATAILRGASLAADVDPSRTVASPCAAGLVAATEPSGTTSKGSAVVLILSAGPAPAEPTTPVSTGGTGGGTAGNGGGIRPPGR